MFSSVLNASSGERRHVQYPQREEDKLIEVIGWFLRDFIFKTLRYVTSSVYLAINSLSVLNFILVQTWEH